MAYWNLVSIPGARRDTVWERIAVVDADTVHSRPAHWIEITLKARERLIVKSLVLDAVLTAAPASPAGGVRAATAARLGESDVDYIVRLIVKRGNQEPVELRLPAAAAFLRSLLHGGAPRYAPEQVTRDDSLDMGDEDVTTARGSARGRHTSFLTVITAPREDSLEPTRTYATDVWTSPDIPITGIARSLSRTTEHPPDPGREVERVEMILAEYGIGARSHITGKVRLLTPPKAPGALRK